MSASQRYTDHLEDLREKLRQKLKSEGSTLQCRPLSFEASDSLEDLAFALSVVADEHDGVRLVRQFTRALLIEEIGPAFNGGKPHDQ